MHRISRIGRRYVRQVRLLFIERSLRRIDAELQQLDHGPASAGGILDVAARERQLRVDQLKVRQARSAFLLQKLARSLHRTTRHKASLAYRKHERVACKN